MSIREKILDEVKALTVVTLYFACWVAVLVLLKQLILAEYDIAPTRMLSAAVGVVILAKVVLVLEHAPLGAWVRARPAWVDVVVRTALYGIGVCLVLLLEKGIEGRHEYGGFGPSLRAVFNHVDIDLVWANSICITFGLLSYNALVVVRRQLGAGAMRRLFLSPLAPEDE